MNVGRRRLLQSVCGLSVGLALSGCGSQIDDSSAKESPVPQPETLPERTALVGDTDGYATTLLLLGTAGGAGYWPGRSGIASALRVGDRHYLIDAGTSTVRRLGQAGISSTDLTAAFITHMHSDHIADLFNVFWLDSGWYQTGPRADPTPVYGPGAVPDQPHSSVSGIQGLLRAVRSAYGHEIDIRNADAGRQLNFDEVVVGREIAVPSTTSTVGNTTPDMDPFPVYEDDHVRVTAVLVPHGAAFPSFAYRFDTDAGSVTFSGDTAKSSNLVRLATGTDVLVHEVIDLDYFAGIGVNEALVEHMSHNHTSPQEVGEVATDAGAKKVVLSHLGPADPRVVTDIQWTDRVALTYSGPVSAGADLSAYGVGRRT